MESIWDQLLSDQISGYNINKIQKVDEITNIRKTHFYTNFTLSEIKKRDIAFQIYSEYVNDIIWICSNDYMVDKMKQDDTEYAVYHIDEIVKINKLKLDKTSLKSIHEAKKCFKGSTIIKPY